MDTTNTRLNGFAVIVITFVSLTLGFLRDTLAFVGAALRFKGKVYDRGSWLFGFGARRLRDAVELGPVLFGLDFYANRTHFNVEVGAFYRNLRFTGTPRRPSTWRLRGRRG